MTHRLFVHPTAKGLRLRRQTPDMSVDITPGPREKFPRCQHNVTARAACFVKCVKLIISRLLASFLIYAWALPAHPYIHHCNILSIVWVRSFVEPDLFDNSVPFDNTTPIYLINLLRKLGLGLGLDFLELHYFSIFTENNENEHFIFREFHGR